MTKKTATLSFSDGSPSVEFPVLQGTLGVDTVDFRSLYAKTGLFSYDPGFTSTAKRLLHYLASNTQAGPLASRWLAT